MKIKYPIEAFALAMIIFSKSMQEAMITGILIVFLTTLGWVVRENLGYVKPNTIKFLCVFIAVISVCYAVFQTVFVSIVPMEMNNKILLLQLMIGLLIVKHLFSEEVESDLNATLYESAIAFAFLIGIGMIREFCSAGSIFGTKIADFTFMTNSFQTVMIGFLFAGVALALVNVIIKKQVHSIDSLWIVIPIIVAYRPFELDNVGEIINIGAGIIIPILLLVSIKYKIVFSSTVNAFKKIPIELISLGIVYMVLTAF